MISQRVCLGELKGGEVISMVAERATFRTRPRKTTNGRVYSVVRIPPCGEPQLSLAFVGAFGLAADSWLCGIFPLARVQQAAFATRPVV